ncbi:hypothetical protein [Mycolicibacterium septicum]|uniref:hypothetical protein n=1 Tax=Mycolicibacterium septicum TaxID=98668 RepID=UPI001AFA43F4|nr:hypothetical protein [Mycolicibacterium septicum]QRY51786.1 hypothetical protein JVX95_31170 [Mycolicibacterium septicum]
MAMELKKHTPKSTIAMEKANDGKVRVENRDASNGDFIWDFYLTPSESRRFGQELVRLADELTNG